MPTKKKEKVKKTYWAIMQNGEAFFTGTFMECWNEFVTKFAARKVSSLVKDKIRVARTN